MALAREQIEQLERHAKILSHDPPRRRNESETTERVSRRLDTRSLALKKIRGNENLTPTERSIGPVLVDLLDGRDKSKPIYRDEIADRAGCCIDSVTEALKVFVGPGMIGQRIEKARDTGGHVMTNMYLELLKSPETVLWKMVHLSPVRPETVLKPGRPWPDPALRRERRREINRRYYEKRRLQAKSTGDGAGNGLKYLKPQVSLKKVLKKVPILASASQLRPETEIPSDTYMGEETYPVGSKEEINTSFDQRRSGAEAALVSPGGIVGSSPGPLTISMKERDQSVTGQPAAEEIEEHTKMEIDVFGEPYRNGQPTTTGSYQKFVSETPIGGGAEGVELAAPETCEEWLHRFLGLAPCPVLELRHQAELKGFDWDTLNEVSERLGVQKIKKRYAYELPGMGRVADDWVWAMPGQHVA